VTRRRLLQAGVLLLLGLIVLVGLLRAVHPGEVVAALAGASIGWILIGMLGGIGFVLLRSWRWKVILDASSPHVRLADVTAITGVGFAINAVGAFKLGDVVRLGGIAQRAHIGVGEAGATVVLERVLDVLALLVLAIGTAAVSGSGGGGARLWGGVIAFAAVSAGIAIAAAVLVTREEWTLRQWSRLTSRLNPRLAPTAVSLGTSVLRGFRSLRSGGRLAMAAALSLAIWIVSVAGLLAFFRALTPQLSPATLFLALSLFTISQAVSITPGSVGTYEGFYLLVLNGFGAHPPSVVAAAAVLSHVGGIVALLLCGAVGGLWLRARPSGAPVGLQPALPREDFP
jgi:glycosyltransferase 2 family protein